MATYPSELLATSERLLARFLASADYNLNETLSIINAEELVADARAAIREWMGAASIADRRFKNARCVLMCLRQKLRSDNG